jgi:phosphoribosylformimino-5-aminoimidazole carboxamide ribotide isomerase
MLIPCIDLMDGKAVQLVRGRKKALDADPFEMLEKFRGFPAIQVIDLNAAIGTGDNSKITKKLCRGAACYVGGGIRTIERVREVAGLGAKKIIIGTSAFRDGEIDHKFLVAARRAAGKNRIMIALDTSRGRIVVRGWRHRTQLRAVDVIPELERYCSAFLCTYVDKEGMMQGTSLRWFRTLRKATDLPITAAGGITTMEDVRALSKLDIDAAVGMAIYTGKLPLNPEAYRS